jgi:hypothetical protein
MDSLLDYFTSVAQIAIETQIENFLYKKLCDEKNMEIVLDKYKESFTEENSKGTTSISQLNDEQKKRYFIKKNNTDQKNVCHVSKKKIDHGANNEFKTYHITCKYCTKEFDAPNIKRRPTENNEYARNLCPNCNKPFEESYSCPNILVHSNILKQFNDVKMNKITWFSIRNINEKNGGRTRRKKRQHKWTRNRKNTNGKRAKSNKKRVQKKKPTKTRKYRSFILLRGGDGPIPIEEKKPGEDYWDKKTPLYDEAMDDDKRNERHDNIVNSNDLNKYPKSNDPNQQRIRDNLENLKRLKEIKNHHLKKEKYKYNNEGKLIDNNNNVIEKPNIRTQISQLKDSFEKRRNAAMHKDTIPEQLFAKNKLPETSKSNEEKTVNDEPTNAVPSNSSSGCCQRTPYNDFIQLISLIFNLSTEFIKEFFGLGDEEEDKSNDGPKQNDILDKIMEILVSSIKLTLPDALGRAFKEHMTKLYMSKSNRNSMKEQIKLQTISRIKDTYWASKIDGLQAKRNFIGSKKLSLKDN